MKKMLPIAFVLILLLVPSVTAPGPVGIVRIDPAWPIMQGSTADFTIWIQGGAVESLADPQILLVMTKECWEGLTGDVVVTWDSTSVPFAKAAFTEVTGGAIPIWATVPYQVSALKDHLDYGLSEAIGSSEKIYWASGAFLGGPITGDPQSFSVTLPSTAPRMLIYALGQTEVGDWWRSRVPPTIPGFMIPEIAPVLLSLAAFSAFLLYAIHRKKSLPLPPS